MLYQGDETNKASSKLQPRRSSGFNQLHSALMITFTVRYEEDNIDQLFFSPNNNIQRTRSDLVRDAELRTHIAAFTNTTRTDEWISAAMQAAIRSIHARSILHQCDGAKTLQAIRQHWRRHRSPFIPIMTGSNKRNWVSSLLIISSTSESPRLSY